MVFTINSSRTTILSPQEAVTVTVSLRAQDMWRRGGRRGALKTIRTRQYWTITPSTQHSRQITYIKLSSPEAATQFIMKRRFLLLYFNLSCSWWEGWFISIQTWLWKIATELIFCSRKEGHHLVFLCSFTAKKRCSTISHYFLSYILTSCRVASEIFEISAYKRLHKRLVTGKQ